MNKTSEKLNMIPSMEAEKISLSENKILVDFIAKIVSASTLEILGKTRYN